MQNNIPFIFPREISVTYLPPDEQPPYEPDPEDPTDPGGAEESSEFTHFVGSRPKVVVPGATVLSSYAGPGEYYIGQTTAADITEGADPDPEEEEQAGAEELDFDPLHPVGSKRYGSHFGLYFQYTYRCRSYLRNCGWAVSNIWIKPPAKCMSRWDDGKVYKD